MKNREEIKTEIASTNLQTAQLRAVYALNVLKPSFNFPVRVYLDGSRWVCIYDTNEDMLKCPVAYGESPKQACDNFDNLWNGDAEFLVDQEEEEEEF